MTPTRSFPSPFAIETPPGCEGWEQMYPYHARVSEHRRAADEGRLWFWNSMHFPEPVAAFDAVAVDAPYYAIAAWQNRVFAVPPAMGIDYRIVNGYVYISANPVTDPALIAERAELFQRRAGHYFTHWDELYGTWRTRMEALNREITELDVPTLPQYEDEAIVFGDGHDVAHVRLLRAYRHALSCHERMWQHHFELLLLGYGAYMTFAELCKGALPEIPDQHIAQMVAGIDVLLFRADGELRRLAVRARELGLADAFAQERSPADVDRALGESEAGRSWLAELEAIKDPWFNMGTGDGHYHSQRSWFDDPSMPYAAVRGHLEALAAGRSLERPTARLAAEREQLAAGYAALLDEDTRGAFDELLALCRTVFPYVEEHKFFCDYWFQTRFFNKIREFGALLAQHGFLADGEDVFQLTRHEVAEALEELCLTWATGGMPLGPAHWPPIVARRSALLARLREWTPPPALGAMPDEVNDPIIVMLWGITPERLQSWSTPRDADATVLHGAAASPGEVEGPARVVREIADIADVRDGEILICPVTSPAWAPVFSRIRGAVTDIGGIMSHAAIVCREYGVPAVVGTGHATAQIRTGQRVRLDGTTGVVTILDGSGAT
jgi:pyruvate,water dikinase